jgi:hypothetical protein
MSFVQSVINYVSDLGGHVSQDLGNLGSSIGDLGNQLDKGVRNTIPGGWATLGVAALAIAAPYLAPYLAGSAAVADGVAVAEAGATMAEAGQTINAANALTYGANLGGSTLGAGGAGLGVGAGTIGSGAGLGLTTAAGTALGPSTLSSILGSMGTGAITGGALGGTKSLLTGQDPIKGALTGAFMGGVTGGALNGLTSPELASSLGLSSPISTPVASALLSGTTSLASGQDLKTVLKNTAIGSGLGYLGGQANQAMTSNGLPSYVANPITGAITGATGSAIKGGDIGLGAETGAIAASLGPGIKSLMAPSTSITPNAPLTEGDKNDLSLLKAQLAAEAEKLSGQTQTQLGDYTSKQSAYETSKNDLTTAYSAAKTAQETLDKTIADTDYKNLFQTAESLKATVQGSYNNAKASEDHYHDVYAAFEANKTQENYDAVKFAEEAYTTAVNTYNTHNTDFANLSQNLNSIYTDTIAPLMTAASSATKAVNDTLSTYKTNEGVLSSVAQE